MNNPYATPASDGADAQAEVRASKPWRIWIFQALLSFQLLAAVAATVSVLQVPEVQGLPLTALSHGLLRPIASIVLVLGLLLALQRIGPKPNRRRSPTRHALVAPFHCIGVLPRRGDRTRRDEDARRGRSARSFALVRALDVAPPSDSRLLGEVTRRAALSLVARVSPAQG